MTGDTLASTADNATQALLELLVSSQLRERSLSSSLRKVGDAFQSVKRRVAKKPHLKHLRNRLELAVSLLPLA
jgi:hypothetical protein